MKIRRATHKEVEFIQNQAVQVFHEATVGMIHTDSEKATHINATFLFEGGGYYLVYVEQEKVLGWIGVGFSIDFFTDEVIGVIPELYVLPSYRNQGIARDLLLAAFDHFRLQDCQKVQLNVFHGNKAKRLYEELGFYDIYTTMGKKLE